MRGTDQDFPFDTQVIKTQLHVPDADLFTCNGQDGVAAMGLTEENAQDKLLPTTGTWTLDGPLSEALTLEHPRRENGKGLYRDTCVIKLRVKRNWNVFFVKQICTMLLVTAGGLLSLLMHPTDLLGDRCAQLLVAVLIIITTLQTDIGLGNLSYLIWVDYFNLMQLIVLIIALSLPIWGSNSGLADRWSRRNSRLRAPSRDSPDDDHPPARARQDARPSRRL